FRHRAHGVFGRFRQRGELNADVGSRPSSPRRGRARLLRRAGARLAGELARPSARRPPRASSRALSARSRTHEGRDDEGRVMNAGAQRDGGGDARELTGRAVLVCLVTFFAVVAGVNAVMIGGAVSTFGGLETESSYQAGLVFAREEAQARSQ